MLQTAAIVIFGTAALSILARWIWLNGLRIGAKRQHSHDVNYIGYRGVQEGRTSWLHAAYELEHTR